MERVMRKNISSGSPFEPKIGFSRAVRIGNMISVSGTAPIADDGGVTAPGDVYQQTKRCLEISQQAIEAAGGKLEDVIRVRVMLVDINTWEAAARAQGEFFSTIRPASTFVEVSRFIHPEWLVETEMDCVLPVNTGAE
jgi:enamine deaminase RidA (YjgF/YER057c/UK114 family)